MKKSKEPREQFAEETNLNPLINPSFYYEWLESKIEEMQKEIEELNDDIDLLYGKTKTEEDEI